MFRYLAVVVDVQVKTLAATAGVEFERRLGPAELKLVIALFAERAAHFVSTVGPHGRSPRKSSENQGLNSESCSHGTDAKPDRAERLHRPKVPRMNHNVEMKGGGADDDH